MHCVFKMLKKQLRREESKALRGLHLMFHWPFKCSIASEGGSTARHTVRKETSKPKALSAAELVYQKHIGLIINSKHGITLQPVAGKAAKLERALNSSSAQRTTSLH